MATVTLAEDTKLGRFVALKRVHAAGDPRGLTRLRREALVGASLSHPNLVSVYDVLIEDDGDLTIVMQYVAGNTLRDVIRGGPVRPAREALRILDGVSSGLDAIHAQGIVHRDVKPANVLLGTDGAVKLADLGIAAAAERTQITTAGAVVGTLSYMAPEQLDGRSSDPGLDIYALSAVAFEMLSGQKARPETNPLAMAHAITTRPPPDLRDHWSQGPAEAATVLQRGMAFDPRQRPHSAGELVRRLRAALDPETTEAMAAQPGPQAPRAVRPRPQAPRAAAPAAAAKPASAPVHRPPPNSSRRRVAPLVALVAVAVVAAGTLVATIGTGGGNSPSRTAASRGAGAKAPPAHTSSAARGSAPVSGDAAGASASPAKASPPSSGGSGSAATPSGAVQSFYESAARHDYAGAWQLADSNLRSQLAGYSSFQSQMSAVRSITFHQAQTLPGGGGSAATVAIRTTSQQVSRTQQCAGTVRTLRSSGAAWLLDGVSINCTP